MDQSCVHCSARPLCRSESAPGGVAPAVSQRFRIARGKAFRSATGSPASVFALRSGCAKACIRDPQGVPHIARFVLPGDLAGLDALAPEGDPLEIVAIDTCEICEIPASRAHRLGELCALIGAHIHRLLARELARSQRHGAVLAHLRAAPRVADFLLQLADRLSPAGTSGTFRLPMRRREIAEHLSLTTETVSRTLQSFARRGWIALNLRGVEITDRSALEQLLEKNA